MSVAAGIAALDADAAPVSLVGDGPGTHAVYVIGSFGDFFIYDQGGARADIAATVDDAGPSLTYDRQAFFTRPLTRYFQRAFTVGLGKTVDVTLSLTFNRISTAQLNFGPLDLTPTAGAAYDVEYRAYPAAWSYDVSGSYTLTGPTQTASGTFRKTRHIYLNNRNPVWDFDSAGYPDESSLVGRQLMQWTSSDAPQLIDATVDGAHILLTSGGENWDFNLPIPLIAADRRLLGDANADGHVNGTDYLLLRRNHLRDAAGWASGDFNADGIVNAADFLVWRQHYGDALTSAPGDQTLALATLVPEPAAGLVLAAATLALLRPHRRRLAFRFPTRGADALGPGTYGTPSLGP
jgi:hypothetical protein